MSFWILAQVFVDLVVLAAIGFIVVRLSRPAKDDPRLSRGLQLLQSKISVLEDLSDRTETQVTQLTALMEHKIKDIQKAVGNGEKQVRTIEAAMEKSLEVAKIFQDKIPHQEIIERQNTIKYVKAARLAHQGLSKEEIATQVDLSIGEIEFISKVNRDQLQFSESDLPEWAKEESEAPEAMQPATFETVTAPLIKAKPPIDKSLSDLGDRFRNALQQPVTPQVTAVPQAVTPPTAPSSRRPATGGDVIKKVVFPRIDLNNLG